MNKVTQHDFMDLKSKIELMENNFDDKLKELEKREEKWKKEDEEVSDLVKLFPIIYFNISGKQFATKSENLTKYKSSLFYRFLTDKSFNLSEELQIDSNPKHFREILQFLRFGLVNLNKYSGKLDELEELIKEAEYFELEEMVKIIKDDENIIENPETTIYYCRGSSNGCTEGQVWGSNPYSDGSNFCRSAQHSGLIGLNGGFFGHKNIGSNNLFNGSYQNGINSTSYNSPYNAFNIVQSKQFKKKPMTCGVYTLNTRSQKGSLYYCKGRNQGCYGGVAYGTNPYTIDSNYCSAAIHMGAIDYYNGGHFLVENIGSHPYFLSGAMRGITSSVWTTPYQAVRISPYLEGNVNVQFNCGKIKDIA
jgi:hypothetical protein